MITRSGTPSPLRSPAATYTPPVNAASNGATENSSAPVLPSRTLTSVGAPGPVPTTTSAVPSPLKSAATTRTPPVNPGNACTLVSPLPVAS